ncbi:MAG: serine protease inhibitor, partial [Vulcanococcus sp.]
LPASLSLPLPRRRRRSRSAAALHSGSAMAAIAGLLLLAALLAPEQPVAQADICQRHNGMAACRVW